MSISRDGASWRPLTLLLVALWALLASGCSLRQVAVNSLAGALAGSGDVFASDEDPELVGEALPFALKTFEALLASSPENVDLLLATCRAFTGYAYGYVELEAERLETTDYRGARAERERALKLYLRARDYCLRALELERPGARQALVRSPETALAGTGIDGVPVLYWTAASWGAAIAAGLDRPELVADLPAVQALFGRVLELDEDYERGAIHDAMIPLAGLPPPMGNSVERAREHFERSVELSGGRRATPYVSWATTISVRRQDRAEFEEMLETALAIDPDALPPERLLNLIQQRRARLLLERADELFLDEVEDPDEG